MTNEEHKELLKDQSDLIESQAGVVSAGAENLCRLTDNLAAIVKQMQEDAKRRAAIFRGELDDELGINPYDQDL